MLPLETSVRRSDLWLTKLAISAADPAISPTTARRRARWGERAASTRIKEPMIIHEIIPNGAVLRVPVVGNGVVDQGTSPMIQRRRARLAVKADSPHTAANN